MLAFNGGREGGTVVGNGVVVGRGEGGLDI